LRAGQHRSAAAVTVGRGRRSPCPHVLRAEDAEVIVDREPVVVGSASRRDGAATTAGCTPAVQMIDAVTISVPSFVTTAAFAG